MFASISRAARLTLATVVLLPAVLLTGCVGQGQYDRLYETNRSLTARNADLTRERDEALAQVDLLRRNYGSSAGALAELERQNSDLRKQLDQALADYRDLDNRLASMKFGPVDPQTDRALEALAAQFPDLIKYDSSRGMLRFASDLTFDSGSDLVKENAKSALNALAQVLTSSSATNYDVVVEGHTDSQRIANPATAREHKTNRRLSAHRAVSVISELATLGVANERMMAAGWGEYRPAVPNTSSGNTPQNRRVEIFLVRSSSATTPTTTTETTTVTPTPEPEVDMSK